mgnify:CR=1 FL=1
MATEARVISVLREYREALAAGELSVLQDLARRWVWIERDLDSDIAALQLLMAEKAANGEVITQQMIWKEGRYQILKGKLQEAISTYNRDYLVGALSKAQTEYGFMGVKAARDAVAASLGIVTDRVSFPVLNRDAIETMAGYLSNGAPLNSLLKNDFPEALEGLTNALLRGIARGSTAKQVANEMLTGMGMGLNRAMLITRTEIGRAYRSGNVLQYRESGVVTGFRRLVKKESACMACLLLDGEVFKLESELDDHPQGNCSAVPVVAGAGAPDWEKGADWFAMLGEDQQKEKLGAQLFEKWQKEGFDLSSLVSKSHSEEWGSTPRFNAGGAQ